MESDQAVHYRLDDEQRAWVRDCLNKEALSLPPDRFERLIRGIEASIVHFLATGPQGAFREVHDALRELWELSHDDAPAIAVLRARIQRLPRRAVEYVDRRVPTVFAHLSRTEPLFRTELQVTRFQQWAANAKPKMLIAATRVLSAEGARIVQGRSRGAGKRSNPQLEPMIMGEVRSAGAGRHRGGRPRNKDHQTLIMYLAIDWLLATGEPPKPGRSEGTGFGELAHCVFQWLRLPEGSPAYALRQYWGDVEKGKARPKLADFVNRNDEET
jgi:hypothetical protein